MTIAEDASTPIVATGTGNTPLTITSASFTPPANSLLVAIGCAGFLSGTTGFPQNVTFSDSAGGTWVNPASYGANTASTSNGGATRISTQYLATSPGAMTVTATVSTFGSTGKGRYLAVRVITGAASDQTGAAAVGTFTSAGTTAATVTITPTQLNSAIYGGTDNPDSGATFTVNGSTTSISTDVDSADAVMMASWFMTTQTAALTAKTLGGTLGTSNRTNSAALEILPAGVVTMQVEHPSNTARFRAALR